MEGLPFSHTFAGLVAVGVRRAPFLPRARVESFLMQRRTNVDPFAIREVAAWNVLERTQDAFMILCTLSVAHGRRRSPRAGGRFFLPPFLLLPLVRHRREVLKEAAPLRLSAIARTWRRDLARYLFVEKPPGQGNCLSRGVLAPPGEYLAFRAVLLVKEDFEVAAMLVEVRQRAHVVEHVKAAPAIAELEIGCAIVRHDKRKQPIGFRVYLAIFIYHVVKVQAREAVHHANADILRVVLHLIERKPILCACPSGSAFPGSTATADGLLIVAPAVSTCLQPNRFFLQFVRQIRRPLFRCHLFHSFTFYAFVNSCFFSSLL